MNQEQSNPHILLVEDNEEDYTTFLHLVKRAEVACSIERCTTGDDALDCLYRNGRYANNKIGRRPALIVLDLNLPGTDGRTVLGRIKTDPHLQLIPVIVFSTSSNPKDVLECYRLGANAYQIKAVDFPKLRQDVKKMLEYWLQIVVLPTP